MQLKDIAKNVIDTLPDDTTLDDIIHALYIRAKFDHGEREIREGKGISQEEATHAAAKRWVSAVNNWGDLGGWCFHVCRDPQLLAKGLKHI